VNVKDALGVERLAPLFFAGPEQVNYLMPAGVGGGSAVVTVTGADQRSVSEFILLSSTSPGLFTANADGQGVPAAAILRIKYPSGAQFFEPVAQYDAGAGKFVPLPIDFGPSIGLEPFADQLFLILFGTGFRSVGALSDTTAMVGNQSAMVSYAGPQGELIGLDQLNLRLSRGLRGVGEVDVAVVVDGKPANIVRVAFR
jgi:uncharacterized protein (TIGR03437 family)